MNSSSFVAFIAVAAGGACGACLRYAVSIMLPVPADRLSVAILLVNIVGCLLAGIAIAWWMPKGVLGAAAGLLVITGVLGAFTTFSAFSVDTLRLFMDGLIGQALLSIGLNVVGSLMAVWVGWWLGSQVTGSA